ncbi:hypothetical protein SESBI_45476 [Sesbania bispinosa]|nr:hypothetical protein SESBI_45476 [Sesbania bispinosa]
MATLFSSSSLHSIRLSSSTLTLPTASSPSLAFCTFPCHPRASPLKARSIKNRRLRVVKAVEEEAQQQQEEVHHWTSRCFLQCPCQNFGALNLGCDEPNAEKRGLLVERRDGEGTLNETAVPALTKALEEAEGVANLKVQLFEGLASVELEKQTTVQATGVASGLVETIQGLGFKLQTLNLSFDDEEVVAA